MYIFLWNLEVCYLCFLEGKIGASQLKMNELECNTTPVIYNFTQWEYQEKMFSYMVHWGYRGMHCV